MKTNLATLLLFCSTLSFGQTSSFKNQKMQSIRDNRYVNGGPFKVKGDAFSNSPNDVEQNIIWKNDFMLNPFSTDTGGSNASVKANIFNLTGKRRRIYNPWDIDPNWQGLLLNAAVDYAITPGAVDAVNIKNTAMQVLNEQVDNGWLDISGWPLTISEEKGANYANVLNRLLEVQDKLEPDLSSTLRNKLNLMHQKNAAWFVRKERADSSTKYGACFPNRWNGDYTVRGYTAKAEGMPAWANPTNPFGNIYKSAKSVNDRLPGGLQNVLYTHVNADGTPGYPMSYLSGIYNNRSFDQRGYVGRVGVKLNNPVYIKIAKLHMKEWLMFSVWPNGVQGEYERNGDYDQAGQGDNYAAKNEEQYLLFALALAIKYQDYDLFTFSTTDGAHGTQSPNKPKTIKTVIMRRVYNTTGQFPIYYQKVDPRFRIDNYREPFFDDVNNTINGSADNVFKDGIYAPWLQHIASIYNIYAMQDTLLRAAENRLSGQMQAPLNGYSTASIAIFWPHGGPSAISSGSNLGYAKMDDNDVLNLNPPPSYGLTIRGGDTIVNGRKSYVFRAIATGMTVRRYQWTITGPLHDANGRDKRSVIITGRRFTNLLPGVYKPTIKVETIPVTLPWPNKTATFIVN